MVVWYAKRRSGNREMIVFRWLFNMFGDRYVGMIIKKKDEKR